MNSKELRDFKNLVLGEVPVHDDAACQALKEYDEVTQRRDEILFEQIKTERGFMNGRRKRDIYIPLPSMQAYADKYHTTIKKMKEHWRCIIKL